MSGRARRRTRTLAVVAAATLAITACGDDDETAEPAPTTVAGQAATPTSESSTKTASTAFVGREFAFEVPEDVPAGVVELTFENTGGEDHQLSLLRLGDDQDPGTVVTALADGDLSFTAQGTFVGAPNGVPSGETGAVVSDVEPGTYVAFCAIPSPSDGVPHYRKGMVATFEVVGDAAATGGLPAGDGEITISADGYGVPDDFTGSGRFTVRNEAAVPAELSVFRLQEGRHQDDVIAVLSGSAPPGPPPFVPGVGGGVSTLPSGASSVVEFDLAAGSYVFLSFAPDPTAGFAPQFTTGLVSTVEVAR